MKLRFPIEEGVFVVAEQRADGTWHVAITDAASYSISDAETCDRALHAVLDLLSSLRSHIWHVELENP